VELHSTYSVSIFSNSIEGDRSSIKRLYRPEVVHDILFFPILQSPEKGQLLGRDLDRLDEVDPVDNFHAARCGEGARVGAVLGGFSRGKGGHTRYKVSYLENKFCFKML
jgi:hypothetical protein